MFVRKQLLAVQQRYLGMTQIQNRGLFFRRRLLNKPIARQHNEVNFYHQDDYIDAMKDFQKKTRGMLPHSPEWTSIRNQIYSDLLEKKHSRTANERAENAGQTLTQGSLSVTFDQFYNLLIVVPEEIDCFEVVHVLNYYGFPINVEEDNFLRHSRKDFGFSPEDKYPYLVIDSSSEEMPSTDLSSKDQILSFLFNKGLIGSYKSHSAYEKQGLEFCDDKLLPAIETLFSSFRAITEFYFKFKHFEQSKMSFEAGQNLWRYFFRFLTGTRVYFTSKAERMPKDQKFALIQTTLDEFAGRVTMQGGKYHGGDKPDAADFRAYALIQRVSHTFIMIEVMKARQDQSLQHWYAQMSKICAPRKTF